ncbi:hypothetical protein VNO77_31240 [Canavalia gladiata]|uniref:Uncharacterized protein n=1 Tax=Canavalia gladiata TaxID=3824 RepID=A0AAN9KP26_CANGL
MTMTMSGTPNSDACNCKSTPKRSPRCYHKYLKPGALAKLRESKIKARLASRTNQSLLFQCLLSPSSPIQEEEQPLNQDNGIPCFAPPSINLNRPRCLVRKKLFAVTPHFIHPDP